MSRSGNIAYDILFSKEDIQNRIKELAEIIDADYKDKDLILVCNLKGAFIFLADLCRQLKNNHELDFIATSSYKGKTKSTGVVRIVKDLKSNIDSKDVLIVEDIVDTGLTLEYIKRYLSLHNPNSIKVVTLLDKIDRREIYIQADYIGFNIPDKFVFGYGLDYGEKYRNLNFIAQYKPDE